MRELNTDEMATVAGGDGVDGNELGCQTAVSAGIVLSGSTGNLTYGTTAGVLGPTANQLCQVTTTYVGEAIGGWTGDVVVSISETIDDIEYSANSLYMAMKWMTYGI